MGELRKAIKTPFGIFFILLWASMLWTISCATVPELRVEYRVPEASSILEGREISLAFEDIRTNKEILGPGAKKDFKGFAGNIALSIAHGDEKGFRVGLYDIQSLFLELFRKRCETLGIKIVPKGKIIQNHIVIALKELSLDLDNRKWIAKMSYEARLMNDDRMVKKQMISGQTDHVKIVGRAQADKVMGDIFTDLINKLDITKLLQET